MGYEFDKTLRGDPANKVEMQRIFDLVRDHLLKQGKRAVSSNGLGGSCAYRASDGTKCAIGFLITDAAYAAFGGQMEGNGCSNDTVRQALRDSGVLVDELPYWFLTDLQKVHDDPVPPNEDIVEIWKNRLHGLAQVYHLDDGAAS